MAQKQPSSLRIRAFQVGFGDCFLLTFRYATEERHVLIDFGTSERPKRSRPLEEIAEQIREACGGHLHGLVATHRHSDHIAGFMTKKDGSGPGDVIATCAPEVVVQPWTEDPRAAKDATAPTSYGRDGTALVHSLSAMQDVAEAVARLAPGLSALTPPQRRLVGFIGELGIANRPAVQNLIDLGKQGRAAFVSCGSRSGLEPVLPGVKIHVLGPPTLKQSEAIRKQRSRDAAEYWHLQAAGFVAAATGGRADQPRRLFPHADYYPQTPIWGRWLVERLQHLSANSLFQLVRILDGQMNNTSVILLFEIGAMRLLFPGDAQIENWSYALAQPDKQALLRGVNLYKVGHHGSLNATPKSLWKLFANRGRTAARMYAINSTMGGKHGKEQDGTEVPRRPLVQALEAETHYFSTQSIRSVQRNYQDFEVDFAGQTIRRVEGK